LLAESAPIATGNSDWHEQLLDFQTPEDGDGVLVRIGAVNCPADSCPLFGRIWLDDFDLIPVGAELAR
jgi:hypothetical protein